MDWTVREPTGDLRKAIMQAQLDRPLLGRKPNGRKSLRWLDICLSDLDPDAVISPMVKIAVMGCAWRCRHVDEAKPAETALCSLYSLKYHPKIFILTFFR